MLARAGREEDAESDYRIALRFAPGDPAASLNLSLLLVRLGRDDEAGAFLDLPELRGNPEALYQRGLIAVRAGRLDEANRILDASIAASASDPRSGLLRAVAWIRQGRGDQALAWVRAWLGRIGVGEIDLDREARQVIDALGRTGSSDEVIGRAQTGTPADKAWDAVRAVRETLAGATLR
jgi:Flp pilus assembly protein TadD